MRGDQDAALADGFQVATAAWPWLVSSVRPFFHPPGLLKHPMFVCVCRALCLLIFVGAIAAGGKTPTPAPWHPLVLTESEKAWLAAHPVIRIGMDPEWPPFSFFTPDGTLHGADVEFIHDIEAMLGVRFEIAHERTWKDVEDKLRRRELDAASGIALTEARRRYLDFTDPYVTFPIAIITRTDAPFMVGFDGMKSMRLIVPEGYASTSAIQRDYPDLHVILAASSIDALRAVSDGQADATVENVTVASTIITTNGLSNLKIAGMTGYDFDLRFAARNDWPELAPILDKALASIRESEKIRIFNKWIPIDYSHAVNWRTMRIAVMWISSLALAIIAVILIWNRRLARELTARRQAEQLLRAQDAQLEAANTQLTQSNEEKDMLVQMVAHDLKNPLTAVTFGCRALRIDSSVSGVAVEHLDLIDAAADRMTQLVSRLLQLHKIEDRAFTLNLAPVKLASIVSAVVARQSNAAKRKGIRIHVRDDSSDAIVRAEGDALDQVLDNLVSNAVKFSPGGKEIEIRVKTRDARVARIEVADQGPGISPEDRAKLFGKFMRLSATPTGGEQCHGLGLSIAKRLVELMHGVIFCDSRPREGATFGFELPLDRPADQAATQ